MVEENECGFYTNPEDPSDFIKQIAPYMEDSIRLETYKNNARIVAERLYSRRLQVQKLINVLESTKSA